MASATHAGFQLSLSWRQAFPVRLQNANANPTFHGRHDGPELNWMRLFCDSLCTRTLKPRKEELRINSDFVSSRDRYVGKRNFFFSNMLTRMETVQGCRRPPSDARPKQSGTYKSAENRAFMPRVSSKGCPERLKAFSFLRN